MKLNHFKLCQVRQMSGYFAVLSDFSTEVSDLEVSA